jgi:Xaa-Pro aminopeptidase
MQPFFTSEFFIGNRRRLQNNSQADIIVITANGQLQRSSDTTFPFRQDSNFWYLTGLEHADFLLVITPDQEFLIQPERDEHRDAWDGAIIKKEVQQTSGISDIYEHHEGWQKLDKLLRKAPKVHTLTPADEYVGLFGFYSNPARAHLQKALQKHRKLEIVDLRKTLGVMRQIKQPVEIQALQAAIDITTQSLSEIRSKLKSYSFEYEINADITAGFLRRGASGHAYGAIVAAGKNSATIHYVEGSAPLTAEDWILFDVGAEVSNYSADISRTYAMGSVSKRQKDIHAAVVRVQQAAFEKLKPGVNFRQYEREIDDIMGSELVGLGVLKDPTDRKKLKKLYPHLTSHFLGLDTHDAADYDAPLAPGMTMTVEPGIYLPDEGLGIRIEDDVLITETGCKVLSDSLTRALA